jgi:hypothetical protein
MTQETMVSPNTTTAPADTGAAATNNAVPTMDSIAAKMAAMRNQTATTVKTEPGEDTNAKKVTTPVAPNGIVEGDTSSDEPQPEVVVPETEDAESTETSDAPEEVSDDTISDTIDFIEFANKNPNAKFKFKRGDQEIEVDAKKAAAILGQGAAIHEEARQLKIQKSEFEEYEKQSKAQHDGLSLALEFTIKPQLQKADDEILKTQSYQTTFQQQLAATQDPAQRARIQANMQQNERYIQQQSNFIKTNKPNIEQFQQMRSQQVKTIIETSRKSFKDPELKNEYIYNETRENLSKGWEGAKGQLVPGIDNIDLIASDEHLLSLVRDGLKYRDRPKAASAGKSIAALTGKAKGSVSSATSKQDDVSNLRAKAQKGDKKAADDLLMAHMRAIRGGRK